jgi:DNA-directed RNA polymerase subunit RPC12/RpoP
MSTYVCERCDDKGTRVVARDQDLDKACPTCRGRGFLTEPEMELLLGGGPRPNVLDWRLFARRHSMGPT